MVIDEKLLDELAALEVQALLEGLKDPELKRNPSFLEKVRKFLVQNRLEVAPETKGVEEIKKTIEEIPVFNMERMTVN